MAEPAASIVATKVQPPLPPRAAVERDRLRARLATSFEAGGSVGLVCAPAGSGKTTLLTSYLDGLAGARVTWLNIDGYDNEPVRFWGHLLAAVGAGGDGLDQLPLTAARSGDWAAVVEGIAAVLGQDTERWVVLDDYHEITAPVVHDHVDLLLRWLPPTARIIVSTRIDPPLSAINRLRLDGRLVELRADDLAFDDDEAGRLLAAASDLDVDGDVTSRLVERTEGWAAGLQLAALSIKRTGDAKGVVDRFAGDDRLVTDYLRAEFLADLDDGTRRFLLHTSILDELTGEACDAMADTTGSAARLRDLEQGHLLIIRLDASGRRFRHHHLITNWLRSELMLTDPERATELHRRATAWFLDVGAPQPAFRHAIASGDRSLVVAVAEQFWHELLMGGGHTTVRAWFDELGPELETSASLCVGRAQLARNSGEPAETAAGWLRRAEMLVGEADTRTVVLLHTNLTVHERMIGDLRAAERHGRAALAAVTDPGLVPEVRSLLGATLAQLGVHDQAIDHLQGAIDTVRPEMNQLTSLFARAHLPLPLYESGQRQQASQAALDAVAWAEQHDQADSPMLATARVVLGLLCLDDGRVEEAKPHLDWGLEASNRSGAATSRLQALLGLARHAAVTNHGMEATRLLDEARLVVEAMPDPGRLADLVEITARQLLGTGPAPTVDGAPVLVEDLTDRELAVLRLLPSELSLRDIGGELFVSHNTIKGHVKAIYRKLAVNSRDQAVTRSRDLGLL